MLVLLTLGKARCWTLLLVLPPSFMIPVPDLVVLLSLCKELYSEPMDSLQEQVRICRIPSEIKNLQTVTSEHETEGRFSEHRVLGNCKGNTLKDESRPPLRKQSPNWEWFCL